MGEIVCYKCGTRNRVTPVKTVTLDDLEGLPEGAKNLARQVLDLNAHAIREAIGSIELAYYRGTQDKGAGGDRERMKVT